MPCYYPITGYRARSGRNENGKWPIVFDLKLGYEDMPVTLPCGRCIGCKLEYSKKWAVRCVHEATLYQQNCFITLTYNDENLPYAGDRPTLLKRDWQLFMKRLRKKYGNGIRFYMCGEYGDKNLRPHYHAILFNFNFPDLKVISNRSGYKLWTSEGLSSIWTFGFHTIGEVSFESSAYVARYILKKHDKKDYGNAEKEFVLMSRKPGIGLEFYKKWKSDIYPLDAVFIQREGKLVQMKPPRYYDNKLELDSFQTFMDVKRRRKKYAERNPIKVSQLDNMERVSRIKLKRKVRVYERNV